ncbi:unnamed protein product [Mytilus coruscus]|uniref:Uncharacterized protein n=1 Tax=Mytilus coruscus TaxID=42192 RepID=A0A6J7ZW27_MYTCO|nr:unnamed protein product [Mytilus coruscus]
MLTSLWMLACFVAYSAAQSCNFPNEITIENTGLTNSNPAFNLKLTSGVTVEETTISDFTCQQQDKDFYFLKSQTTIPGEGGEDQFVYLCIKLFQDDSANVFASYFGSEQAMVGTQSTDPDDKAILVTTAVNADFCDVCRPHVIDGSVVPTASDVYSVVLPDPVNLGCNAPLMCSLQNDENVTPCVTLEGFCKQLMNILNNRGWKKPKKVCRKNKELVRLLSVTCSDINQ